MDADEVPAVRESTEKIRGGERDHRTGGFTLIEVILAVALSATLLTVVYWTYFNIDRTIDSATENQEALETGRMLSELIKKDIRGISDRFVLKGKNETVEGRSLGRMEFVTTAGFYKDTLKLRRIGYELFAGDNGDRILVRRESTDLDDPLDGSATVFELSRIVKGFRLEFFNGSDWTDAWDSDTAGSFPKEVKVTFDVSDAKGNDKRFATEETVQSATQ